MKILCVNRGDLLDEKERNIFEEDNRKLFAVRFNYKELVGREKAKELEKAQDECEVRWIRKMFSPMDFEAEYIGIVLKPISSSEWLKGLYEIHLNEIRVLRHME